MSKPVHDYPINSEELARRLLGHHRDPQYTEFLQGRVRPLLRRLGCPKGGTTRQARWLVDEAMASRVASELGRPLP